MARRYKHLLVCLCTTALLFSACGGGDEALRADGSPFPGGDTSGLLEAGPSLACGPGTHEQNGYCVPDLPAPTADTTSAPADAKTSTSADAEASKSPDAGSAVIAPEGPCRSNDDCVAPARCSLSGECEELAASQCGPPQTGACGCAASETCVPLSFELEKGTTTYVPYNSGCYPACDPCAPSCDPGKICIALPEGGGFCHFGALAIDCFTLSKNIGIADGAISLGGRCAEDRNCQAGLRCVDGPYYKICALL